MHVNEVNYFGFNTFFKLCIQNLKAGEFWETTYANNENEIKLSEMKI